MEQELNRHLRYISDLVGSRFSSTCESTTKKYPNKPIRQLCIRSNNATISPDQSELLRSKNLDRKRLYTSTVLRINPIPASVASANHRRMNYFSARRENHICSLLPGPKFTMSYLLHANNRGDTKRRVRRQKLTLVIESFDKIESAEFTAAWNHTGLLSNVRRYRSVSSFVMSLLTFVVIVSLHINYVTSEDTAPFRAPSPSNRTPTTPIPTARFNVTVPTMVPTVRRNRTNNPTMETSSPTQVISDAPTSFPTNVLSLANGFYRQEFLIRQSNTEIFLNDTEIEIFTDVLEGYTPSLLILNNLTSDNNNGNNINIPVGTNCSIDLQNGSTNSFNETINNIDYRCQYTSRVTDVTNLPDTLLTYLNNNLTKLTVDLQQRNLNILESFPAITILIQSPPPSIVPSIAPTIQQPVTGTPSLSPSTIPTEIRPTTDPDFVVPTLLSLSPINDTNNSPSRSALSVGHIVAIVIGGGLLCLAGLFMFYRYKQKRTDYNYNSNNYNNNPSNQLRQERRSQRRGTNNSNNTSLTGFPTASSGSRRTFRPTFRSNRQLDNTFAVRPNIMRYNNHNTDDMDVMHNPGNYVISPTDSHLSNKSLLSTGDSVIAEGSGDNDYNRHNIDEDGTKNLQDEFDLYKDQNLELLRTDVEGNLSGFEGYMSAAVTNALMGDDEKKNYEMQELLWGCDANPEGTEIEASALFEVTDWLNRNESASTERKGAFMQEILNKMVTSVRFGVIIAEDASRTIHESAAILGLQLAEDLPVTTVIISGMRKTTRSTDIINALNEFGDIDVAAVASGKRGFGIVRFRRRISVDHALQQYRAGEIVILDVSIQMKVLMPNGVLESR